MTLKFFVVPMLALLTAAGCSSQSATAPSTAPPSATSTASVQPTNFTQVCTSLAANESSMFTFAANGFSAAGQAVTNLEGTVQALTQNMQSTDQVELSKLVASANLPPQRGGIVNALLAIPGQLNNVMTVATLKWTLGAVASADDGFGAGFTDVATALNTCSLSAAAQAGAEFLSLIPNSAGSVGTLFMAVSELKQGKPQGFLDLFNAVLQLLDLSNAQSIGPITPSQLQTLVGLAVQTITTPNPPNPTPTTFTLTVQVTGQGSVSGGGIQCAAGNVSSCSATVQTGTTLTLTAQPATGSSITSWNGANTSCGSATLCQVVVTGNATLTVAFTQNPPVPSYTLTANEVGNGTVTGAGQFNCVNNAGACSAAFPVGTAITLTAVAAPGWTFAGWSSAAIPTCNGATCQIVMPAQSLRPTATFTQIPQAPSYTLTANEVGNGTVTGAGQFNCVNNAGACSVAFPVGTAITLTAVAAPGWTFAGWSSAAIPTCNGATCQIVMPSQNLRPTATFTQNPQAPSYTLTANEVGNGTVTGAGQFNCVNNAGACSATFQVGTTITLTAVAAPGWTFAGWSSAAIPSCNGTTCQIVMPSQNLRPTATFTESVVPTPVALTAISVNPSSVGLGTLATVTITLSGPAPQGGATVSVVTSAAPFPVPATITVPAGQTSTSVQVQALPSGAGSAVVTATYLTVSVWCAIFLTGSWN
jgi:hypothetical protein